ncbi:MAG: zinc ribbon domain-containing protein [Afipia sp.]|nr:zinc ribbon domain-containing protein [Afipia sp.]
MVVCAECEKPLTACWSTSKTGAKHPYYMCFEKSCERNRKSIRREKIETEFASMLQKLTPEQSAVGLAYELFKNAWAQRMAQAEFFTAQCKREAARDRTTSGGIA